MKKLKMYVNLEDLNEHEKEHKKISYKRLIDRISNNIWLFNNAPKLSEYDFEFEIGSDYDEETGEFIEFYQYYLIDISPYMIEKLQKLKCKFYNFPKSTYTYIFINCLLKVLAFIYLWLYTIDKIKHLACSFLIYNYK